MPEVITKYPNDLFIILKAANFKCAVGEKQNILKQCPSDKFCSSTRGEICAYTTKDMSKMTQINYFDLLQPSLVLVPTIALLIIIFSLGMLAGIKLSKKK